MTYVEGFITPVPKANREAFVEHSARAAPFFAGFGARRVVDALGDDVPEGKRTDFLRAVKADADEAVGFGWIEYPDKATRQAAVQRIMNDTAMHEAVGEMPFDGKRMVFSGFEAVVEEGPGGEAGYVDGFVGAVPTKNRDAFVDHAAAAAPLFLEKGALRVVECWGEDVARGEVTDFYRAVAAEEGETVIYSWIEWPDKATREAAVKAVEAEMEAFMKEHPMPFDGSRMIFGGFEVVADRR